MPGSLFDRHLTSYDLRPEVIGLIPLPIAPGGKMEQSSKNTASVLDRLSLVIESRRDSDPECSYTAQLFNQGIPNITRKFGEESVECIVASLTGKREELIRESADVLYHLLVLWAANDVNAEEVWNELARRDGVSGITEKEMRKR